MISKPKTLDDIEFTSRCGAMTKGESPASCRETQDTLVSEGDEK